MLAKLLIIENENSFESFGYDESGLLLYHIVDGVKTADLEAIYKARIKLLNKKSRLAYIDYVPGLQGVINLKDTKMQAGSHLLCQMTWQGDAQKLPKFSEDIKLFGKYVIFLPGSSKHFLSTRLKFDPVLISEKYKGQGLIFRSQIDTLTDYAIIKDEINFLIQQADSLKNWLERPAGQLTAANYKFMQLLREARLSPAMEIFTNSQLVFDQLLPYLDLWQLEAINLDKSLGNIAVEDLPKQSAEFGLEIHKLSGINLIDINSKNAALNFFQVNYLAIDEIIRQIWLKDLTGIILLDFIKNMSSGEEQQLVAKLTEILSNDWRRWQILGFTKAGICEIIRSK